ncbi:MAG: NAD-glutamate dehydrogenase [Porticoccaceae bacterium]
MNKNTSDAFFGRIKEYFDSNASRESDDLVAFAKKLYKLAPLVELFAEPVADLCGLIRSLRHYFSVFKGDEPKVRSFNPNLDEDGWEHGCTQIFILQKDMAFLVDSVRMALTRQGLGVQGINSTVFNVVRDDQGRLVEWLEEPSQNSHREALFYFQVDHYISAQQHEATVANLRQVLESVRVVNADYQPSVETLAQVIDQLRHNVPAANPENGENTIDESIAFLEWVKANHFTFIAYSYYSLSNDKDPLLTHIPARNLGLFKASSRDIPAQHLSELAPGFRQFHASSQLLILTKSTVNARVHLDNYCDYLVVKDINEAGQTVGEHRFLGLYTSLVYSQSPFGIPLVRHKLNRIFERSGLNPSGHYGKALRQVIEVHPREELFHGSEDQLYDILIGIWQINERRQVRLFVRADPYEKFVNCIVFFPRDSYRTEIREKAQQLLMAALDARECQFSTFFTQSLLARAHFVMRIQSDRYREINVAELEKQIAAFTNDWRDDLHKAIMAHWGDEQGIALSAVYRDAFPVSYQSHFEPRMAVQDITLFDGLGDEQEIALSFFQTQGAASGIMRLKAFHLGTELSLSRMVPMLENLGFEVIGEHPYPLSPQGRDSVWVHDFTLKFSLDVAVDVPGVRQNFIDAFKAVWLGNIDDDAFNWLVIGARLDWRSVALIRLYARYMKQLGIPLSQGFIAATLAANLEITRNLVALFKCSFDPKLVGVDGDKTERSERITRLEAKILESLDGVNNLNQDQVLRTYLQLICATQRTNFFQRDDNGDSKPYIAIKLAPKNLAVVPQPRPEYEIFIYSPRFEGVHLRSGKVARGGIRWSDRVEDYRTEILSLVKAQQVKNAVIVPAGAKGGFVVKQVPTSAGRSQVEEEAKACYALFMGGLLDITDNIRAGQVVAPQDVVRRDGDDAYLVVAADKGTASFSDLANSVSEKYGHWLGDAFASGGSHGYDHKKIGITAKGAWVAVQRHFREIGVNIQEEEFSVVGIGDMSGDVFGNGMLLSPHIRLVAAFNHRSIFIDPNPNVEASFAERQRLFALSGSSWDDYSAALISTGGGVFSRDAKAIKITAEMKQVFDIGEDELTPAQLIRRLLLAPVDLIWNGGIGTYVKSSRESHSDAGDRANDELRVDGAELRCKVFGEGGNLGMTQRGRVEFALNGGACNSDFIDNSAGVDCSDHEVNIKIALNQLVVDEDLTLKQRNLLLEQMTDEVTSRVLHHNYRQSQAISLAVLRSQQNPSEFWYFMADLDADAVLSRRLEYLPDDDTLSDREKNGHFLARPELAILLSYSKILFKQQLLSSDISGDPYLFREVYKAFPKTLFESYPAAIEHHALRSEVLCNQLAGEIIDTMGLTYVHRQMKSTGASPLDVARAYIIARDLFDLESVWVEVEKLDFKVDARVQLKLQLSLMQLGRRTTRWLLRNRRSCANTEREITTLKPMVQSLLSTTMANDSFGGQEVTSELGSLREIGISDYAAMLIDSASDLYFALGMADTSLRTGATVALVSDSYAQLGEVLQLEWFSGQIIALQSASRWEDSAREMFMDELEYQFRFLVISVLEILDRPEDLIDTIEDWKNKQCLLLQRWQDVVRELRVAPEKNYAMFSVALRELEDLVAATRAAGAGSDFCATG